MGTTANEIETDIERTRTALGSNIQELEHKVKTATDWRHYYRKNPLPMMGAAFGGGILLSALIGGHKRTEPVLPNTPDRAAYASVPERQKSKAWETWDNIKGALIGVAATQLTDYVDQLVPGFRAHYDRTQHHRQNQQQYPGWSGPEGQRDI